LALHKKRLEEAEAAKLLKIQEKSARKQALSDKNKEKDRENQAAILKEQPLVEGMMKFGWLPEDFIV